MKGDCLLTGDVDVPKAEVGLQTPPYDELVAGVEMQSSQLPRHARAGRHQQSGHLSLPPQAGRRQQLCRYARQHLLNLHF